MKRIQTFIIIAMLTLCMAAMAAPAADNRRLAGRVTDATDGMPVVGATIYFPLLREGTVTDAEGMYEVNHLPAVKTTIQVSYVGHQTIIETIDLRECHTRDFELHENNAMLNEVVVTGLTGNARADQSPAPVSVVTPRTLLETSSTNIVDAIAHQPGVAQITTGSGIAKPVIRGLGYNRIVVVNDDIRQEGQQWGDEHGIEVDAQSVHSAEILKGPASLMYGSDAMAGVLVLHGQPVMPQGTMAASVGGEYQSNNRLWDYTADFAGNRGATVWNWRWSQKDAGDYTNRRDGRVSGTRHSEQALTGMVGTNRSWGYTHLKLSGYHLKPGLVEEAGEESSAYQQIHHYKAVLDNALILGDGSLKAIVGYQQNRRQEYEDADELGLDFRLHTVNYDLHYASAAAERWQWAAGVSGMWQRSENLGDEFLIPSYHLLDIGAFASATIHLRQTTISGGLRADNRRLHSHSLTDDGQLRFADFHRSFQGATGSLGAIRTFTRRLCARVNLSRGFRAPNLSELGSNGEHEGTFRYEIGNQRLAAERSWQADLGIDYSSEAVSAQLSLFANHISNYIYLERVAASDDRFQYQSGTARLCGFEMMVDVHPLEPLHVENTFSYVNARQLHQPSESRWLPFTPAPRWTADVRYDIVRDSRRRLNNTYVSVGMECHLRQNHVRLANATETVTPSYTLFSLGAGTDLQRHGQRVASIFLTAQNLGDRVYQSHLSRLKYAGEQGVCNMGRNVTIKLLIPITL